MEILLKPTMTFKIADGIVTRYFDDETILVKSQISIDEIECIYVLNHVGSIVLNQIKDGVNLECIYTNLIQEFEIAPKIVMNDIDEFIKELINLKILIPRN